MASLKQLALEELIYVGHVKDLNQSQVLHHQHVEGVEDKVSRRFDRGHS